ncbi:MAG TPA: SWIM zinc finger family protein [Bacillota bacterium]|nr:SWIM zinc finger family protein [Bacillota bacterium]
MGKKIPAWFIQQWLSFFERQCPTYTWQRGKMDLQRGYIRQLEIRKGRLEAFVLGMDTYQVEIKSRNLSEENQKELEKIISRDPALLMKIYQRTLVQEDVVNKPHQLGFALYGVEATCSCHGRGDFCSHIIAVVLAAVECYQADYSQFLIFQGLNWEVILSDFGNQDEDAAMWDSENFSLLPIPEGSIRSFESRMGAAPPFWTASFSFQRMLEEILRKVRDEE